MVVYSKKEQKNIIIIIMNRKSDNKPRPSLTNPLQTPPSKHISTGSNFHKSKALNQPPSPSTFSKTQQFYNTFSSFKRHDSQKQFKKYENLKGMIPSYSGNSPYVYRQRQQKQKVQQKGLIKVKSSQIVLKRSSNNSNNETKNSLIAKDSAYNSSIGLKVSFQGKRSQLKQTYSTTNTDNQSSIMRIKSQVQVPSFIKNMNQSKNTNNVNNPSLSANKILSKNNFRIIKLLGQGKFGSVYLTQEIKTGLILGLKQIPKERILKDNFLVQLIRQLKIQSFLDHPNIIKIYNVFDDDKYIYIIMELGCDGQLYDIISTGQTLTEEAISFIIGNLLEAINVMHKNKILHRDIKPQNIVLVHGNIKLCDFGWAVNKKQELRSTFCGTPLYLSPEMLQGARYDQKVDLWAIGVLTYELFYGKSPFDINEQQDLLKIITDQLTLPENIPISKQFRQFLTKILIKNPKDRLEGRQLIKLQFISKYSELQTCQELCN